jgi:RNA polymerase sigma-70 factor (ECF subfamily)
MFEISDEKRFHQLYKDHHRMVRNVLYNMVDEKILDDLVQETFLRIWKGLPRFGFKSSIRTWIYRISIHTAIDHLRTIRLRPREVFFEEDLLVSDQDLQLPLNQELVQKALQDLDSDHRSVVILHFFEDQSISQIAKILEIPPGTVKSRIFSAKNKLRKLLDKEGSLYESI